MRRLLLFGCLLLLGSALLAQHATHFSARERGWVTFGIDGGLAYQTSDVRTTFDGWGAGLTLGKNLAYRPGGLLSFDLRGRLLFTRSYGRDWRRSTGLANNLALNGSTSPTRNYLIDLSSPLDSSFVYANHRTGMGELGLEGVLTFNRLRERTGVVFSLFGGIGLNVFRTRIDQLDANNQRYNYLNVSTNGRANALANLSALRDGTYESRGDGLTADGIAARFMPGAGVELGYQVAPRFVIGVGHKITFSRTDILDGQRWTNDNEATLRNDWAHYTNLHFRWDIARRKRTQRPPEIEITDPSTNPYIANEPSHFVRARIRHVRSAADVRCYVNGQPAEVMLRDESFGSRVRLMPGRNEIRITASNLAGSDEASTIIIWEDRRNPGPPPTVPPSGPARREPIVRITDPGRSIETERDNIYLRAGVENVRNERDIRVLVNGREARFTLAEGVEANIPLEVGRNTIRVEAQNSDGRASDEVVVTRTRTTNPTPPPTTGRKPDITLTQPRGGSANTSDNSYVVKATIDHIDSRDQVTLTVNGRTSTDFSYNRGAFETTVPLTLSNEATVTIRARNRQGEDEVSATIRRNGNVEPAPPTVRKPDVSISTPADNSESTVESVNFKATTRNVDNRSELRVTLNGTTVSDFDFNDKMGVVSGKIKLREGDNTLTVRATNGGGTDEATVRVRYRRVIEKPSVSISDPTNGTETDRDELAYRASTRNVSGRSEVSVLLNSTPLPDFEYNSVSGIVSGKMRPREGDNTLTIRVSNAGGSDEQTVRFRYRKPMSAKPTVSIVSPGNGSESSTPEADLRANVTNVTDRANVTVQINGRAITNFDFNPRSGQVSARVSLANGDNNLRVSASNAAGSAEASTKVRFAPKRPPTVTINTPADKSKLSDPNVTLNAKLTNVFSEKNVTVLLNNQPITNFNFDRSGTVTASLTLASGANAITVRAETPDGSATQTVNVSYASAVAKPTVSFTQPGKLSKPVSEASYTFKAKVSGITEASGIRATVNGTVIKNPTFNAKTGEVAFVATLKEGRNTARVEATNTAGTSSADAQVTYTPKASQPAPVIESMSASTPTGNPMNPAQGRSSVLAKVKNVTDRNQISLTVNGTAVTNFDFVVATGNLSSVVSLTKGSNTIVLTVTTPGGTVSETRKVDF
jgi:large repetitive protein